MNPPPRTWQELAETEISLVRLTAQRMKASLPACVELEDMIGAGNLGLCQAARNYDARRRCSFRTYATRRIWGAIMDWLRHMDPVPRLDRLLAKREGRAHELPVVISIDRAISGPSFQAYQQSEYPLTFADILPSPNGCPVKHAADKEWPAVFKGLSVAERTVIDLKYRAGLTLKQIGIRLGVSESRACQIHKAALAVWRRWLQLKKTV